MTQTKAELLQTRHQGDIRLGDADSSHYVGFKAPATVGTSLVWTLPAADGTAGYYLKTDGSGNLGWSLDNSGVSLSGSTNNTIATVTGANALQGEANLTFDGSELKLPTGSGTQGLFFQASSGSNANLRGVGTNYGELGFFIGNNEKFRLDGIGRLLLGTAASRDNDVYFQIEGLGYQSATMQITRNSANADCGGIYLLKTRGTAVGQSTVVQSGDQLGIIDFRGADGTDGNTPAASIGVFVDGTPGANDMPGRLTFSTTADGANSATERMRIDSSGRVGIGTTSPDRALHVTVADAPSAKFGGGSHFIELGQLASGSSAGLNIVGGSNMLFNLGGSEAGRFLSSGRLLLGTTTEGHGSADELTISFNNTGVSGADQGRCGMTIRSGDNTSSVTQPGYIFFSDGTSGDGEYKGSIRYNHTGDSLEIASNATTALTLDSSQNATFASAIYGPVKTVSALELDLRTGNYFIKTISGNSTFTFANPAASGTVTAFTLELTHSSGTVTWPSSVKWNADTAPTLTTGKTHLFMFVTDDGGTRYRGSALVDYVN
jgi:hypothetical protein